MGQRHHEVRTRRLVHRAPRRTTPNVSSTPASTAGSRRSPEEDWVTASWRQVITATSEANLRLGLGRLTDLITRGTIFKIVTSHHNEIPASGAFRLPAAVRRQGARAARHLPSLQLPPGSRHLRGLPAVRRGRRGHHRGRPTFRTTPRSTNGRALSVSIAGDLPTPVEGEGADGFRIHRAAGAQSRTTRRGRLRNATALSDYQGSGDTALHAVRGHGRGLDDRSRHRHGGHDGRQRRHPAQGTSSLESLIPRHPTVMARRVEELRTANLNSLRGSWDVWLRCKAAAARRYVTQLTLGAVHG